MLIIVFSKVTNQIVYASKIILTILLICMFVHVLDILVDRIRFKNNLVMLWQLTKYVKIILIKRVVSEKIKLHSLF